MFGYVFFIRQNVPMRIHGSCNGNGALYYILYDVQCAKISEAVNIRMNS